MIFLVSPVMEPEWEQQKQRIVSYLMDMPKKYHRSRAVNYLVAEYAALVVIILNGAIMHIVFNGFWVTYYPAMASLVNIDYRNFTKHSAILFPTQAKCLYHNFGLSGSIQNHDALCFLPQNTVNEKIFVFYYFWFVFIFVFQAINNLYWTGLLLSSYLRKSDLCEMSKSVYVHRKKLFFSHFGHMGVWFSLSIIRMNLNMFLFNDLLKDLVGHSTMKQDSGNGGGKTDHIQAYPEAPPI